MLGRALHLFSFFGRASRREYWAATVPWNLMIVASSYAITVKARAWATPIVGGLEVLLLIALELNIALGVRRLHDRARRGWWLLPIYGVPFGVIMWRDSLLDRLGKAADMPLSLVIIGCFAWGIVELGVLRGTPGQNRYGGKESSTALAAAFD